MDILSKLSERLQELMFDRGISSPVLTKVLNAGNATVNRYLAGTSVPEYNKFVALVEYFNCSADFLLGLVDHPPTGQAFRPVQPFATQFRVVLERQKCSQYRLQKETGISWASFNAWLHGRSAPNADTLVRLAKALECSVDFLLGREA